MTHLRTKKVTYSTHQLDSKNILLESMPVESYEKGLAFLVAKNYKRLKIIP